jgi:hypothetical protein
MSAPHRIDVHQHVVPPFYAKALLSRGDPSGTAIPQWSPAGAIDFMDSQAIATGILSLTAPSVVRWDKSERREMARRVNEYTADLVAKRPDRFGNFATLPVRDVEGALRELDHALDTLRADGVISSPTMRENISAMRPSSRSGRNSTAAKPSSSCIPGSHPFRLRPVSPARSSTGLAIIRRHLSCLLRSGRLAASDRRLKTMPTPGNA